MNRSDVPPGELRIPSFESVDWGTKPQKSRSPASYVRLRGAGCYAFQIDGTSFSRVIVFRALGG